jgi:uncharacterized protein
VQVHLDDMVLGGQRFRLEPADVLARVELQRTGDGVYMKLRLRSVLVGPCYRCLEDAHVPIAVDASEYGRVHPAAAEEELASEYLADERLDVGQWVRDAVGLAVPTKLLCRDDCGGLCPRCGIRLDAAVGHACGPPERDERWAKLRELL